MNIETRITDLVKDFIYDSTLEPNTLLLDEPLYRRLQMYVTAKYSNVHDMMFDDRSDVDITNFNVAGFSLTVLKCDKNWRVELPSVAYIPKMGVKSRA